MLKILQARLQQYVNRELSDVQAELRKGRGTRDQIAGIHWIMGKAREFQENIYFCFIDYAKAFDFVGHHKQWKILKEMEIPDHLTYLLRNLYACQEATIKTGHGTTDRFQISKADVFLELSCFFDDPMDVGNLTSGFSVFSKSSLNSWKFTVHLVKPGLENFEHYFSSV